MTKSERTRQFILEQAAPVFNEKGIAGTTIDDVLAATKMAKGGLYGHFESKEALGNAIVDFLLDKIFTRTALALASSNTAKGKLLAFMDIYKNPMKPVIDGGCPVLNMGVESDDTSPVIKQKVKAIIQKSLKIFSDIIRQGIEDKEFSQDFNAEEFSLKMLTLIEGGMLIGRIMGSDKQMKMMIGMLKKEIESYELK